jgi:hypothetical protein
MKTMVVGTLRPRKAQAARSYRKEIAPVGVAEMGVAFTLFRAAVLDDFGQSPSLPLTHDFVKACFSEQAYQRGMLILAIHFDHPDIPNAFMRRLDSFVRLLQNVGRAPGEGVPALLAKHNTFGPLLHALSWCPAQQQQAFPTVDFLRIAAGAPLQISLEASALRPN